MDRIDVINSFIRKRGYRSYLEIGPGACFGRIACEVKDSLDPATGRTVRTHGSLFRAGGIVQGMPRTDAYFAQLESEGISFDVIVLFGGSDVAQTMRDVSNALARLSPDGVLLLPDCVPVDPEDARRNSMWRAFIKLRMSDALDAITTEFDYGIGIIRKIPNPLPLALTEAPEQISFEDYKASLTAWMRPQPSFVIDMVADRPWRTPTVAMLVIGKSDEEIAEFKTKSPHVEQEARLVYVSNPGRRHGATAAIANPFFDAATEDVLSVVHADTTFAPGAIGVFARAAIDNDAVTGIVGRIKPMPEDPLMGYTWCHAGGGFVSTLDSCSVFMRRTWGLRIDGATFDDFHCVIEDLCMQARVRGLRVFVPNAQAGHVGTAVEPAWNDNFWRYRQRLLDKYPGHEIHTV